MMGGREGMREAVVGALWGNVGLGRPYLGLPGRRGDDGGPEFSQGSGGSEKTMP